MCTRVTLAEVRQLQKAAGILNENDIDYSLDEMLNEQQLLMEKGRPCGYIIMKGGSMIGQRHELTKFFDSDGYYRCLDLNPPDGFKPDLRGLRLATSDETDWAKEPHYNWEESVQEDAVPKPTGRAACPPGYTSYATGLDPNGVVCLRGQAPQSINGKPPKKITPVASKPGAPVPLKEKAPLPGCGPMWDGQKAVEGVRWMLDGDPGRHSTCLLPGRKPDFKVEFGGRLYSLVPYTNQEGIQEAIGASGISAAAPCGPTFTAISIGPKSTDYACFPTNGLPQKINGKPIQKKVASTIPVAPKPGMQAEDAMGGIDEAGNIKGIKIEIPGNSYASDFGKAAAREVIASFTPMGAREFLEAFVEETRKIATARMAARSKAPKAPVAPTAPTPQMQAEGIDPAEGSAIMHWVKNMYSKLTMEQFHKLVAIYSDQWKNEKEHFDSVEDFLGDLEDSSDPEAIIPIRSLKQYSGY
jgi:hypothetical protein